MPRTPDSEPARLLRALDRHADDKPPAAGERAHTDCPTAFWDPWSPEGTAPPDRCPRAQFGGTADDSVTGEMRDVFFDCQKWRCPACGPRRLRQHMAHYRGVLTGGHLPLLFLTLTLRPGDAVRLDWQGRVDALRDLFASRFIRRLHRADGNRPRYLAQVDVNEGGTHHHIHAVVETVLHPSVVAGLWIGCGGGVNHDIQALPPPNADPSQVADDVTRVAGYVVKGSRWVGHGRIMCSQEIGYGSAAAVAARAAYRDRTYGEQRAREVFVAVDKPDRPARPRPRTAERVPFAPSSLPEMRATSPVSLPNGEYVLITRYDVSGGRATVTAADVGTGEALFRGLNSPTVLRRMLEEYDATRGPEERSVA